MPFGAVDPGASRNACGIACIDRAPSGIWAPLYLAEEQGQPGRPLDVRNVLVPHGRALRALGCESWATDGWSQHDVHHASIDAGLSCVVVGGHLWEQWRHIMTISARDQWSLSPHVRMPREQWPKLDALAEQLSTVLEKFANGERTVVIPEVGTSHGDLATAFARCFLHARAADIRDATPRPFDPRRFGRPACTEMHKYAARR